MKPKRKLLLFIIVVASAVLMQSCGGGGGGGTPPAPDKTWHHPASLTDNISPSGSNASPPQTAMDDNGNAIVVWVQSDGANDQIFKSMYRNGLWTHPATTADHISPTGFSGDYPSVAMDNNGNALIVWRQFDNSGMCAGDCPSAYKSEFRNGTWSAPSPAGNLGVANPYAFPPRAAMDDNGNAIIVWRQSFDTGDGIFKSEYRNGVWTQPTSTAQRFSPAGQMPQNPQVAMDNNGNAIIVWQEYDGTFNQIFKSEYRNGTWTHPASLAANISPDGLNAKEPLVAMGSNGNAIISWLQSDGSYNHIYKSVYRNSVWTHPTSTLDHINSFGQGVYECRLAMDNNGNAIIVYRQFDTVTPFTDYIYKSEYRNGLWTHPTSTSDHISPSGQKTEIPAVAMDDNGNAIIVWGQLDGADWQTFKSEYRNGAWTNPSSLADNISPDGQSVNYADIAMGNNGNAIIVWDQPVPGGIYHVFKSEYR